MHVPYSFSSSPQPDQSDSEIAEARRYLLNLLHVIIHRLPNLLHIIIERKLLPSVSETAARIDTLQFIRFRCFRKLTTLDCAPITLVIGKNNAGKSNILEAFRLCAVDSFRSFLLDYINRYGSEGLLSGLNYIFSHRSSSNHYYPPPMGLGFVIGETIYNIVITRRSPFLFIEWHKNQERLCTLVASDNLARAKFIWGTEPVHSVDGRSLTNTLTSKSMEAHFDNLRPLIADGIRIIYHPCWWEDKRLLDDLEIRLATRFSPADAQLFLSKSSSYFEIPALTFVRIGVGLTMGPTPNQRLADAASLRELDSLRKLLRDIRKRSNKKRLLGKVLAFVDELANSFDPDREQERQPGSGGLILKHDYSLAKDQGSGLRSLLLLCLEIETNDIILIDEPESFLHPSLQSKLASYILNQARSGKQFVIASHSEIFLNSFFGVPECTVLETQASPKGFEVKKIHATHQLSTILDDLGLKASYLLQSNAIIWVEGPSDRVYIKHWIEHWSHGSLKEGVHYQCLSYGGKLLSHFSATGEEFADPEKIAMLRINRHAVVVIDSDRRISIDGLNATKDRIIEEVSGTGGIAWVTHGRTIENYIPNELFQKLGLAGALEFGRYDSIDNFLAVHRKERRGSLGKVELARRVSRIMTRTEIKEVPDLKGKLDEICSKLCIWNDLDTRR